MDTQLIMPQRERFSSPCLKDRGIQAIENGKRPDKVTVSVPEQKAQFFLQIRVPMKAAQLRIQTTVELLPSFSNRYFS